MNDHISFIIFRYFHCISVPFSPMPNKIKSEHFSYFPFLFIVFYWQLNYFVTWTTIYHFLFPIVSNYIFMFRWQPWLFQISSFQKQFESRTIIRISKVFVSLPCEAIVISDRIRKWSGWWMVRDSIHCTFSRLSARTTTTTSLQLYISFKR